MIGNSGRGYADYKAESSIGDLPFTNKFVISAVINDLKANPQIASPLEDIATLPQNLILTPQKVFLASTSDDDNITGIGARLGYITGLGEFGEQQDDLIILNGKTPVESNLLFSYVMEFTILEVGSNVDTETGDLKCVGDIYVGTNASIWTNGKPSEPLVGIKASQNNPNSRDGIFRVPAGKVLLLRSLTCGTQAHLTQNISLIVEIGINIPTFDHRFWFKTDPFTFDGTFQYLPEFLLPFPPLTRVQIRAKTTLPQTKISTISLGCDLRDIRLT